MTPFRPEDLVLSIAQLDGRIGALQEQISVYSALLHVPACSIYACIGSRVVKKEDFPFALDTLRSDLKAAQDKRACLHAHLKDLQAPGPGAGPGPSPQKRGGASSRRR